MSKKNIAQQYNSMVASIEDAKIYDGRGEYNLYECNKCNNYKVTLYKDKGVIPQGRVTDHRIKLTLHKLDTILNGDLDEVIDSLIAADQSAKLANMNE